MRVCVFLAVFDLPISPVRLALPETLPWRSQNKQEKNTSMKALADQKTISHFRNYVHIKKAVAAMPARKKKQISKHKHQCLHERKPNK